MTALGYAFEDMGRGRKPDDDVTQEPKVPYATRLPKDVKAFLASRENQAAWITREVRAHPEYEAFSKKSRRSGKDPGRIRKKR